MRNLLSICLALLFFGCNTSDDSVPPVNTTTISVEDKTFDEGDEDSNVSIFIRLNKPAPKEVTASIAVIDLTASLGSDYTIPNPIALTFQEGEQEKEIIMTIKGDPDPEVNESFTLSITEVSGASIANKTATITIRNDDGSTTEVTIPETGYSTPETYPGLSLIWRDEFDAIESSNWTFETGTGNSGWGNNELQYYREENTSIVDGHLVIEALQESFGGKNYTSSRMITKNKFDFQYGRVDIRANIPYGQGIWPALWMLGSNISSVSWPACGEIDIMEMVGHQAGTTYGTAHWADANGDQASFGGNTTLSSGILNDEFHVFSIIWDATSIRWYIDDVQYHVLSITDPELSELTLPQFFIMNVAVGGNWPGSPDGTTTFPQRMIVDYIRVFQ